MSSSSISRSRASQVPSICDCGFPAIVAQAWTDRNPGRKFWACPDYDPVTKTRGCRVFKWYDEGQTNWQKEVILRLKRDNERLEAEKNALRAKVSGLYQNERKLKTEIVMVKMTKGGGVDMVVKGGFWTIVALLLMVVLVKMMLM